MAGTRRPAPLDKNVLLLYAYHEAGHAVVGHVIGRYIREVCVDWNKKQGYTGYCAFDAFVEDICGHPEWHESRGNPEIVTILYGGMLAMAYACVNEERFDDYLEGSEGDDLKQINSFFERFYPDEQQRAEVRDTCWKQAQEILRDRFYVVSQLAERLVEQRRLTEGSVHNLLRQMLYEDKEDWRVNV